MKLSRQHEIWNRACLESGGPSPAEGDRALASLLLAHGLIMNGGVVHALGCLSQSEIAAAIAGFEYFGLTRAADALKQTPDETEETEQRLDQLYWSAVPDDETLVDALRVKLLVSPEVFSPMEPE
jgi:hypothetical protein